MSAKALVNLFELEDGRSYKRIFKYFKINIQRMYNNFILVNEEK